MFGVFVPLDDERCASGNGGTINIVEVQRQRAIAEATGLGIERHGYHPFARERLTCSAHLKRQTQRVPRSVPVERAAGEGDAEGFLPVVGVERFAVVAAIGKADAQLYFRAANGAHLPSCSGR